MKEDSDDSPKKKKRKGLAKIKEWKCLECDDAIESLKDLRAHYTQKHEKDPHYQCTDCEKLFDNYKHYKAHLHLHTTESYSCNICGKTYFQRGYLKHHMLMHSDSSPHKCSHCNKS